MPLAFDTLNRGTIAFGFFNIESDMLLLQNHFFFADRFCAEVVAASTCEPNSAFERAMDVFTVRRAEDVGDLGGAIHGVRLTGFIGETYRRWPFPADRDDFRQSPDGRANQAAVREMIERFAESEAIRFSGDPATGRVSIGEFEFSRAGFHDLVRYVWRGGYPRWRDGVRPDYVLEMRDSLAATSHPVLAGCALS